MEQQVFPYIQELLDYGLKQDLFTLEDKDYIRNQLLSVLELDFWIDILPRNTNERPLSAILESILEWSVKTGRIEKDSIIYRDLLDTKIMGVLVPRPSEVINTFQSIVQTKNSEAATDFFYKLSQDSNYIRTDRISKNEYWTTQTEYGELEITINLSKPEKDPLDIIKNYQKQNLSYPECLLCKENVGYVGRVDYPARQNLRTIPLRLNEEVWYFQYSPYTYYREHAIVFSKDHRPMKITRHTIDCLLDFTDQFPHYFIGSNADLPIVGGSILSHDHFQGGYHSFPMAEAEIEEEFTFNGFEMVKIGIVNWPVSTIRLSGIDKRPVSILGAHILKTWRDYSDDSVGIHAYTDQEPHNTITPIARIRGGAFELDLVLRNNCTNKVYPFGIFHPHEEVHHIKKENIGLIEVMGLAILPGRLKEELELLAKWIVTEQSLEKIRQDPRTAKHIDWIVNVKNKYPNLHNDNVQQVLQKEVGYVFSKVLDHVGVFKRDQKGREAFRRFIEFSQKNIHECGIKLKEL
ncbi:UDP-glucose--hexose-1-phosphate uridylyltransferase [Bacillus sp. RG28]|uniref:Galactose-1-phosphate uridylyltransferase n=1 Tax=Gottfriedia endophytica TaxID=2820819 RepID=A0A940NT17_9BACI|nr:UDP-glucose--hexose-1-phosphate uridylyltransferase [Gottfriedia endophytica]MBP0726517.1 UDP-glucose--hexose-1-phosphate uridylyltransferase [Gottfriedia endophytica]